MVKGHLSGITKSYVVYTNLAESASIWQNIGQSGWEKLGKVAAKIIKFTSPCTFLNPMTKYRVYQKSCPLLFLPSSNGSNFDLQRRNFQLYTL